MNWTRIHPKVGWPAFIMAVATAVEAITASYGYAFTPAISAGIVALIGAATGYAVPSSPAADTTPGA